MGAGGSKTDDHPLIPDDYLSSSDLVIVLIGHTGEAKAAVGNVILGNRPNDLERGFSTDKATRSCNDDQKLFCCMGKWRGMDALSPHGPTVTVVNTPGYPDGFPGDSDFRAACVKFHEQIRGRPHVWLWVKRADDSLEERDFALFEHFSESVGSDVFGGKLVMLLTQSV
jgi:hypothetical protein